MGKKAEGQATENEDVVLGDESGIGAVDNGQGTEGDSRLAMDAAALVQSTRKEMNNGRNERQD
jgi:hypothetical protein